MPIIPNKKNIDMDKTKFRYSLDRKGKKHLCLNCHKKTFVRFIDLADGNFIPEKYGRCDREDRCGYFMSPYHDGFAKDNIDPSFMPKFSATYTELPISYVHNSSVYPTLKIDTTNALFSFLVNTLEREKAANAFTSYRVGFQNDWCIFWQHDIQGRCRSGKYMKYLPTGRRDKSSLTTWEHARRKEGKSVYPEFNLKQCFFGEHLLANDTTKPVAIVESEKTAIIASILHDGYIWLACGSKNGISDYKMDVLSGRKVMLYPDLGAYSEWYDKAVRHKCSISDILEKRASKEDRENGLDLADFLLREYA